MMRVVGNKNREKYLLLVILKNIIVVIIAFVDTSLSKCFGEANIQHTFETTHIKNIVRLIELHKIKESVYVFFRVIKNALKKLKCANDRRSWMTTYTSEPCRKKFCF